MSPEMVARREITRIIRVQAPLTLCFKWRCMPKLDAGELKERVQEEGDNLCPSVLASNNLLPSSSREYSGLF